jgi:hypothetical protein
MSKNHSNTAAEVTAELSIQLEDPVSTKMDWWELQKSNSHGSAEMLNLWLLKTTLKGEKDGEMTIKPGRLMIGNT